MVVMGVGHGRIEAAIDDVLSVPGVRAIITPGLGNEAGPVEGPRMSALVSDRVREAGIAMIGPNCMGVATPGYPSPWIGSLHPTFVPGPVATIAHSGSIGEILVSLGPRIGFRTVVSAGNETVTDVADMVAFFADDPDTRVIGLFLEAVRRPAAFEQALQLVAEAGKVAIVLKVGTSEMGARAALTHTGAMVGSDQVFSGMLRYYNAIRVDDFGNWLEHLEVFSRATPPRGRRIGAVTNSGGEGEYFADKAEQAGIPLQEFSPELKARIVAEFPNFSGVGNPVDCWAIDDDRIVFPRVFELMAESGEFDVLVSDIDHSQWLHAGERELATNIANDLRAACHRTDLFPCVITVTTADPPIEDIEWARQHDIPLLKGSLPGLRALAARLAHRQRVPASRLLPAAPPLPGAGDLPELESARIAASYGLSYVRAERCASADEAAAAAEQIGYPVVVKIDNVAHKAKVGGVALGLADAAGVREAARRMGGRVIVAEQVLGGVELLIGVTRDPDFGATVSVGVGGGLAEALELITHSLAPLDADGARELVASLPVIERLLGGEVPDPPDRGDRGRLAPGCGAPRDLRDRRQSPAGLARARRRARLPDRAGQPRGASRMSEAVLYETRGPAAWVTLNRPEKLNALNGAVLEGLHAALDRAVADDEVKVVVVTGAGERAFSAGYDLSAEAAHSDIPAHQWHEVLATDIDATMKLWALPKPTIAAVRGYCLAGGCELAMACDMIISTESGRFGEPEIRYGSGPVTLLMPFLLGQKKTNELLFTGDMIDAQAAERAGMINRVVAEDELDAEVEALVRKIAPTPLPVLRLTKIALVRAYEAMGLREAVNMNLDLSSMLNAADAPEQREFMQIVQSSGLKAALAWRDNRYGEVLGGVKS